MSSLAERRLRFIYEVVDGLSFDAKQRTAGELIEECFCYIKECWPQEKWKQEILDAMRRVLSDEPNRKGLAVRLEAVKRNAVTHPDKGALITDLARRALLGELGLGEQGVALQEFLAQMDRLYAGDSALSALWDREWVRVKARFPAARAEGA